MTAILVHKPGLAPIQPNSLAGNGRPVSVSIESSMRGQANQIIAYRGKELFSSHSCVSTILSAVTGTRDRWRFYAHTGPYCARVNVWLTLGQQDHAVSPANPSAKFTLMDTANNVLGTFERHYGATPSGTTGAPNTFAHFSGSFTVAPDTDVHGLFQELDFGTLVSALVWETGPAHDTANGYLIPTPGSGAPIQDNHRQDLVTFSNLMWRRGGAHIFNWSADEQLVPRTLTGTTPTNVFDGTSTTITAATPGVTLDMTGKDLGQQTTGVPFTMAVRASTSGAGLGQVELKDSTGAVIALISGGMSGSTAWYTGTGVLPASSAKYDLHMRMTSTGTISVYAVSLFEHMT